MVHFFGFVNIKHSKEHIKQKFKSQEISVLHMSGEETTPAAIEHTQPLSVPDIYDEVPFTLLSASSARFKSPSLKAWNAPPPGVLVPLLIELARERTFMISGLNREISCELAPIQRDRRTKDTNLLRLPLAIHILLYSSPAFPSKPLNQYRNK